MSEADKYADNLVAHCRRVEAERDAEILTGQKYRELGSAIFAEINAIAERAIGHPIEPGYTAVYAVELLADRLGEVTVERDVASAEIERLTAKCNRMCRSAKIEDIQGRRS